jgi:hypothetical protein
MDITAASSRPRDRRTIAIVALAAALLGVLAGRTWPTSGPAGATVDTWHAPVYADPGWSGFTDAVAGYGIDGEGFVHLRGAIGTEDVGVERANVTTGPWVTHAFTLPCGMRPESRVIMHIGAADVGASTPYEGFLQINTEDGQVFVGSWDMPVSVDGEDASAAFIALLDGVTFQAAPDSPECVDEEPTTTTTTTEPETTTTTTEPEE